MRKLGLNIDAANAEVVFPYLTGEDLNGRSDLSGSRWVIDFNDRNESAAERYRIPFARLLEQVKPERAKDTRAARRERWWQFAERASGLRKAIESLDEVLVIAQVSRTLMPARVQTGQVFSMMVVVFATDSYADQAVLSSGFHQAWAIKYGSAMRSDPLILRRQMSLRPFRCPDALTNFKLSAKRFTPSGVRSCCADGSGLQPSTT